MRNEPLSIDDTNLSDAWGKAFLRVMERGMEEISPLVVTVHLTAGAPAENLTVRQALDKALLQHGEEEVQTVANTIFPANLWKPGRDRNTLYDSYRDILPRLRRHYPQNRNGLYFERMIAYGATGEKINQLEHVIQTYLGDNHRRSALQITIFDPHSDHTNQKQRGFPCLQSVSIAPLGAGELAITGYYPVQYIFAKAYGNYLGLCRLGNFIAHELQMEAVRMTCIAAIAVRGQNKSSLVSLQDVVHEAVRTSESV